ncbi:hypothetical protein F4604DRAFT_1935566 [Suillus subluteus]|nr:hypothetical protein F4604DRAFT_1935566 [Suillus subluteus]
MSSGPIRNIPRRRHAQTPFYPLIEARPSPSTSRLQVIPAHAHDVIEIISDDEAAGQAASIIELTTTDDEVASQASPAVHREPTLAVAAEDVAKIPSGDNAAQQASNVMPTSLSDALAAATAELENLRAAIQKVLSERDSSLECAVCKIVFKDLHSLKCGHGFCAACLKQWFQSCWTRWVAHKRPPVGLTSRDISTLPLPLAVISAVTKRFGHIPFTCPTCRDLIGMHQPYKVIALGQLSNALSLLGGEQGEEDPSMDWTGYFPLQ